MTKEAQDAWVELLLTGPGRMIGSPDCTPGYYNNEGQDPGRPRATMSAIPPAPPPISAISTAGGTPATSRAWRFAEDCPDNAKDCAVTEKNAWLAFPIPLRPC